MAEKFIYTVTASVISAAVVGAVFYLLSVGRAAASSAYTVNDTYMGTTFVFLLAFIIGLSAWPGILERRVQ